MVEEAAPPDMLDPGTPTAPDDERVRRMKEGSVRTPPSEEDAPEVGAHHTDPQRLQKFCAATTIDPGPRKPAWGRPEVRELEGAPAIIRRAYGRFSPDHPLHRHEPNYADDYQSEGARVLTWVPPTPAPVMRMAA
jgi:hypothetical protein